MSMLFQDSADHYTTGTRKWSTGTINPTAGIGRQNTAGYSVVGNDKRLTKHLGGQFTTLICGVAIFMVTGSDTCEIMSFLDGGVSQMTLVVRADGSIRIYRGHNTSGTPLTTSVFQLPFNAYQYLETKVVFANGTGVLEVRAQQQPVITLTGIDSANTANTFATQWRVGTADQGSEFAGGNFRLDDFYILDDTVHVAANPLNDYLGDYHIEAALPVGPGDTTQFTIGGSSPAPTNWESVDEPASDGDTTVVRSSTVGHRDLYHFADLTTVGGTPRCVSVYDYARKEEAGNRQLRTITKAGGAVGQGLAHTLSTDFLGYQTHFPLDPNTAAVWTVPGYNGTQVGAEIAV